MVSTADSVLQDAPAGELVLSIRGTSRDGQVIRVRSSKCTIGSGPQSTVRLHAIGVQPTHCLIVRGPQATIVRRWTSDTLLNGAAFTDAELTAGDRLTVGPIEFEVLDAHSKHPSQGFVSAAEPQTEQLDAQAFEAARRTEKLNARAAELDAREQELAQRVAELASREEELARRTEENETRALESDDRAGEVAQRDEELNARAAELDAREQELAQRVAELASREEELARRTEENETRVLESDDRAGEVAQLAEELNTRAAELDAREQELSQRATDLTSREQAVLQQIEELEAQTTQATNQAEELERRTRELDAREQELFRRAEELDGQAADRTLADDLDRQAEEVRQQAEQVDERACELDRIRRELDEQIEQLEVREHQLDGQAEELDELASRLAIQAEELEAERAEIEARLAELDASAGVHASEPETEPSDSTDEALSTESPDEVRFEEVARDAPLTSLDVFRRMGNMPDLPEDGEAEEECSPVGMQPRPGTPASYKQPSAEDEEHEDDVDKSIDQYMTQLLNRLRGGPSNQVPVESSSASDSTRSGVVPEPYKATEEQDQTQPAAQSNQNLVELSPRAMAPEKSVDLSAMRELANFSAKQAIERHSQRILTHTMHSKLVVTAVSALAGIALLWFWWQDRVNPVPFYGALVGFLIAMFWGVQHLAITGRLIAGITTRRNSKTKANNNKD